MVLCTIEANNAPAWRIFHCSHTDSAPSAAGAKTYDVDDVPLASKFSLDSPSEDAQPSTLLNKRISQWHSNQEVIIAHGNRRFTIDSFFIV